MNTTIKNNTLSAVINAKGAELFSLQDKNSKEFMWEGNPEFWGKHSPVLFPIVGTLKNNTYVYDDVTYHLPRHGFARDMVFEMIEHSDNKTVFALYSSVETKKVYPFDFELKISYTLLDNKLVICYQINNKNNFEMPFAIGAHPAFALPNDFEDYSLEFEHPENLTSFELENDLLSNKTNSIILEKNQLPLTYSLFEKDAMIFKDLKSRTITILDKNNPFLRVDFNGFENLGLWTKPNAPFICIEPWLGYSDTIKSTGKLIDKEAIHFIAPKKEFECCFSIEIL